MTTLFSCDLLINIDILVGVFSVDNIYETKSRHCFETNNIPYNGYKMYILNLNKLAMAMLLISDPFT